MNARINSFYHFILLEKKHNDQQSENMIMKRVKRLTSADSLGLRKTRKQCIVYFLLMFWLKPGYFSGAFKTTGRIAQDDFDMFYHNMTLLSTRS